MAHWSEILEGPQGREQERQQMTGYTQQNVGPRSLNALKQYGDFLGEHWSTLRRDPAQGFYNALSNTFSAVPSDRGVNALSQYLRTGEVPPDLPEFDVNQAGTEMLDVIPMGGVVGMTRKVGSKIPAPGHVQYTGLKGPEVKPGQPSGDFMNQAGGDDYNAILKSLEGVPPEDLPRNMMLREQAGGDHWSDILETPTVRKKEKKSPAKRMTRAEAEEAGYWHPIGVNKKLPRPTSEMSRLVEPYGNIPPARPINLESMQGGVLIPAPGDRSDAGMILKGIGDAQFPEPVRLEGGHGFMRENPEAVWASDKGVITKLSKKARNALEEGRDPYLTYMPMGHGATNFNTMTTDAMLGQIRGGDVSKTAKLLFDRRLRKIRPEWKGIDHPESMRQLESNGALRHAFSQVVNLDDFQRRNFPNMAETRFGVTDPSLLDTPLHHGGQSISRLSGEIISDPVMPHSTYNTQIGGEYVGGIPEGVPREILFPDFTAARRKAGLSPNRDYRSFDMGTPTQIMDQEWLDRVMGYLQR